MTEKIDSTNPFSRILNGLSVFLLKAISHLPFPVMYGLSDITAFFLHHVIRYRKKVVVSNLQASFPEKSEAEIRLLTGKFYHHLADLMLETIKAYSMSMNSCQKRIRFHDIARLNKHYDKGESVILFSMHYNNWEWINSMQPFEKHSNVVLVNPMRNNPQIDLFFQEIRARWGARSIPVNKAGRFSMEFHKLEKPVLLGLVADQRPPSVTPYWIHFMGQETCFNSGPVKIARSTNQPVYFLKIRKLKRGCYDYSFIPLFENPAEKSPAEILAAYVAEMEKCIREAPEFYLWSHRRWKQKRPDGQEIFQFPIRPSR